LFWAQLRFSAQPRPTSIFFPQPAFFPPFPAGPQPLDRPVSPVGHALVAPCLLTASLTGRRLQSCRLCPSPCPADRWAPPVIPHLRLRPSSAASPPPPATPHTAQHHTSGRRPSCYSPQYHSPLNSPLNLTPSSMTLKSLMPPLPPLRPPLPGAPSAPIKGR
jgi:hypothetical protein